LTNFRLLGYSYRAWKFHFHAVVYEAPAVSAGLGCLETQASLPPGTDSRRSLCFDSCFHLGLLTAGLGSLRCESLPRG
jgi:hypothetical protein